MIIYLYVKTHRITGLKYLGKTKQDPFKYKGSGKYWTNHIKIHGNDVDTIILHECNSNQEVRELGLHYSLLWNIVESDNWANLKPENGKGGSSKGHLQGKKKPHVSESNRKRSGENHYLYGKKNPQLSLRNSENVGTKNPMYGKISPMRGKKNPALSTLNKNKTGKNNPMCKPEYQFLCQHCGKIISKANFVRWHGDKCKLNISI